MIHPQMLTFSLTHCTSRQGFRLQSLNVRPTALYYDYRSRRDKNEVMCRLTPNEVRRG